MLCNEGFNNSSVFQLPSTEMSTVEISGAYRKIVIQLYNVNFFARKESNISWQMIEKHLCDWYTMTFYCQLILNKNMEYILSGPTHFSNGTFEHPFGSLDLKLTCF